MPNINTGYRGGRQIVPQFPPMASDNQQALYMLADGTGGFVILNTNDLLGGLQKIGAEQDQHYIIGYSPVESAEGSCHTLKVKVDRGGTNVRARSGYCNVKQVDLLSGTPTEKSLEARLDTPGAGTLAVPMQVSYFYTAPNTARVDVSMDLPAEKLTFDKVKGKLHSDVNIMGVAYKPDGSVGARFSDTLKLDVADKKELEEYIKKPVHYENQFDVAPGQYTFKLAFNAGPTEFGKLESPLAIEPYDGKQFSMSGIALTSSFHKVTEESGLDAELLQGLTPMIYQGVQITPSGKNQFKKTDSAGCYLELYEPLIVGGDPVKVGVQLRIVERASGEQKVDSGTVEMTGSIKPGNAVVPIALKIPVANLAPGSYRLELTGLDSAGKSVKRTADFNVTE